MRAGVQIEHEVDEGARQAGACAAQHGESRTRDPRRALEVEDAERWTKVPVGLRLEVERPRRAVATKLDIVRGAAANRHAGMGQVGKIQQRSVPLIFDRVELDAQLFDLGRALLARFLQVGRVVALALRARDFVARCVLLALQPLELRDEPASSCFEGRDLFERAIRVETAVAQPFTNLLNVIANIGGVEHV
jgi:hypothetical protein